MTRMTSKWLLQPLTKIICVFFVFFKDMFVATFETNEIDVGSGRIRIPVELGSQLKLIPYQQIAVVVNSGQKTPVEAREEFLPLKMFGIRLFVWFVCLLYV
eukprot:TRINITY_DN6334_c0_g1_i13.p2 TRINITY_DN6334_c0_g1~~TRINITY_DN6334_c0_g1_i13.p2  ORF type:complete len:110 (-),score=4.39 TRINITY_DN6334_c0_g1_i13:177-479(-)